MAKKPAKQESTKSGVDAIIDYLNANRAQFGAIVVAASPMPGKQLPSARAGVTDFSTLAADLISAYDDESREAMLLSSPLTLGLANKLTEKLQIRSGGLFG